MGAEELNIPIAIENLNLGGFGGLLFLCCFLFSVLEQACEQI